MAKMTWTCSTSAWANPLEGFAVTTLASGTLCQCFWCDPKPQWRREDNEVRITALLVKFIHCPWEGAQELISLHAGGNTVVILTFDVFRCIERSPISPYSGALLSIWGWVSPPRARMGLWCDSQGSSQTLPWHHHPQNTGGHTSSKMCLSSAAVNTSPRRS